MVINLKWKTLCCERVTLLDFKLGCQREEGGGGDTQPGRGVWRDLSVVIVARWLN
jgi:hypothetical protein